MKEVGSEYIVKGGINTLNFPPKSSDWQCYLFGDEKWGLVITPAEGKEPNWFHRKMQEWILGFKWRKKV